MTDSHPHWEIERRWLIARFPNAREGWPLLVHTAVQQGYLATSPTVRIRSSIGESEERYRLCFKSEGTLKRREMELPLTGEQFACLREMIPAPLITKDFRIYRLPDGHQLECSWVDAGQGTAFLYAEVEFSSEAEAAAFVPPAFLGEEKTDDPAFSMRAYWLRTRG